MGIIFNLILKDKETLSHILQSHELMKLWQSSFSMCSSLLSYIFFLSQFRYQISSKSDGGKAKDGKNVLKLLYRKNKKNPHKEGKTVSLPKDDTNNPTHFVKPGQVCV